MSKGARYNRVGVLDIGSNSVRFVIFEMFGAAFTAVYNEKVLAGLGRELTKSGRLDPKGRIEALAAIKRFRLISDTQGLDKILVGATAAMRMAEDAPEFIREVKSATGWDISPVSGDDEARLTAQGLIAAEPRAKGIAADLGGASLELINVKKGKVGAGASYPVGPFQIIGDALAGDTDIDEIAIKDQILGQLNAGGMEFERKKNLYLIGGAWRNLAGIHQRRHLYPLRTLQAYELMPGAAQDLARWACGMGRADLLNWPDIAQRRAETLPYSGLLLDVLLKWLKPKKVIISTSGLRQGLVYDAMPKKLRKRDALLDGCRDLARGNLQGLGFAQPLLNFLEPINMLCPAVFDADNENRIRQAACHLVGIGKGLHPDYRAELVFHDVLYAPLSGLTHKERAYLALILFHSYTSKRKYPNAEAIDLLLSLKEREAAYIYGSAIRLGVVISGRTSELLDKVTLVPEDQNLYLDVEQDYQNLLTERVNHRLIKLCSNLGLKAQMS